MTPLEDLARIQREWAEIERMIQRHINNGSFPFTVVSMDGNYAVLKGVAEQMGLHVRGLYRRNLEERGVVVCLKPADKRQPKNEKVSVGGREYLSTQSIGGFGESSLLHIGKRK